MGRPARRVLLRPAKAGFYLNMSQSTSCSRRVVYIVTPYKTIAIAGSTIYILCDHVWFYWTPAASSG